MSPILGIWASADQSQFISTNSYESISTVTVGSGGSSTITFSSIPSTYKHLQIRGIARDNNAVNDTTSIKLTFNSDTTSTYVRHYLYADGAGTPVSGYNATTGFTYQGAVAQNSTTANCFGVMIIDILDYQNTNKYKTIRTLSGADYNGSGAISLQSGLWQSTSAITNISFISGSSANFMQYSQFALFGVKG